MNPMTVPCPHCHASPWQRCTAPGVGQLKFSPAHPSRMEAVGLDPAYDAVAQYRRLHTEPDQ